MKDNQILSKSPYGETIIFNDGERFSLWEKIPDHDAPQGYNMKVITLSIPEARILYNFLKENLT